MKNENEWLDPLFNAFKERQIIEAIEVGELSGFPLLAVQASKWSDCARVAAWLKCRWLGIWAKELEGHFQITEALLINNKYCFLRTIISKANAVLASHAPFYLAANRMERHIHDLFGVDFLNYPDNRRWTRHKAWSDEQFPLRDEFSVLGCPLKKTPADSNYHFLRAEGEGVYEIPVGPVHAGIIEPGHFRFQVAGEDMIYLEERLGYVHKGIEKIATTKDLKSVVKLAGRVSGDSTASYAWATCQAIERALQIEIPLRALFLRAIIAERERIANHLWDIAAICNDVGFTFAYYQFGRLRENWLCMNATMFGHRLLMDCLSVGGVRVDLNASQVELMQKEMLELRKELADLYPILEENSSLQNRLRTTGVLSHETAMALGVLGYVGKASGLSYDVRRNNPYVPYDRFEVVVPVFNEGDVSARLKIRMQEILGSLELLQQFLSTLPLGGIQVDFNLPLQEVEGVGIVEGWRGEILVYISLDQKGRITRFFPRDPSWFNWLALERLIYNDIVPDFPVCNKSINGSYAGCDL